MQLISVALRRFRNIAEARLEPGPRATVLVGENGQGKTNVLEAIHLLGTLKPLRATRLSELVPLANSPASAFAPGTPTRVEGRFLLPGGERTLAVTLANRERQLEVDGKRARGVEDYLGHMAVVAFTPDDLSLVKGVPEGRRRFLDRAVFGRVPGYLTETRDYLRALKSRNRLLRERAPAAIREAFDLQLASLGARMWRRRLELIAELKPTVQRAFDEVGRLSVSLHLEYRPSAVSLDEDERDETVLAEILLEGLNQRLPLDSERQYTSVGPHADDLSIRLGNRSTRAYASQGQQRATVLALKIGEIESLRERIGRYPLLLLDDVSSELDPDRNQHLMEYLRRLPAQVLMSTTDPALVMGAAGDDAVVYRVRAGTLQPVTVDGGRLKPREEP